MTGDTAMTVTLYTDGILEYAVDGVRTFGGDFYSFRKAPLVLHLKPGKHVIDLRLVRDVRAFGGVGAPTIDANLEARVAPSDPTIHGSEIRVSPNDLEVAGDRVIVSDVVDGRLASPHGTVAVRNNGTGWVEVFAITDAKTSVSKEHGASSDAKEARSLPSSTLIFILKPKLSLDLQPVLLLKLLEIEPLTSR